MMIETRICCDECGAEIAEADRYYGVRIERAEVGTYDSEYLIDIELCEECYQKIDLREIFRVIEK